MDYLNEEGYKKVLREYISCFSSLFPKIHCSCDENGFCVNGQCWKYSDITGTDCTHNYLVVEIMGLYKIYLPTYPDAQYHIEPITRGLLN